MNSYESLLESHKAKQLTEQIRETYGEEEFTAADVWELTDADWNSAEIKQTLKRVNQGGGPIRPSSRQRRDAHEVTAWSYDESAMPYEKELRRIGEQYGVSLDDSEPLKEGFQAVYDQILAMIDGGVTDRAQIAGEIAGHEEIQLLTTLPRRYRRAHAEIDAVVEAFDGVRVTENYGVTEYTISAD